MDTRVNRLAREPSLYLRQHAHNPVDWYPWGADALERAAREDKPILLSIGYSACHWCHVMERECFENPEIARAMNERFVCIKVDREERPDLDNVYMKAVQMMTGRGGWPMTVFLTPDLRPFYAGTYFPPEDRGGMPGFPRVLDAVAHAYHEESAKIAANGARIVELLERNDATAAGSLQREALVAAADNLIRVMDAEYGGFGRAPKFPPSSALSLLMSVEREQPDPVRRERVRTSLDRMADGGIYDHLCGGFHRYSVDRFWLVPHFEKMLYDQAQLAAVYAEAFLLFGDERYAAAAAGVLDYVARDMTSPEGAFYAAQDADSEGEEGKFYVWSADEVREVVGAADAGLVCRFFDVTDDGNFEGRNILHRTMGYEEAARMFESTPQQVRDTIARAKTLLLARRAERVPPATDTKILADWNGLMIGAMASAGRLLGLDDMVGRAARAADFVRSRMMDAGELHHFYAQGEARVRGFLDDYAFFGRGSLELFFALRRPEDLKAAQHCASALVSRFADRADGGFFLTGADAEKLIVRPRDLNDGAVPSGGSVAAELLLRLHQLTGDEEWRHAGESALLAGFGAALADPYACANTLVVSHRLLRGFATVVVARAPDDEAGALALQRAALLAAGAETSVLVTDDCQALWLPEAMRAKPPVSGTSAAYVCRGRVCHPPVTDPQGIDAALRSSLA